MAPESVLVMMVYGLIITALAYPFRRWLMPFFDRIGTWLETGKWW